jgi:hypothetical protein
MKSGMKSRIKRRLLLAALGIAWKLYISRQRAIQHTTSELGPLPKGLARVSARRDDQSMRRFIGYFVLPVWLAAGFLDYLMHRKTKIETTSGLSESLMHTLMMVEAGPAVFGALFLEINAGVIAMIVAASVVHEATAIWDVVYTSSRRTILPAESHIHSFLEMAPFCVASAAISMHWNQARALVGSGPEEPDYALRLRLPRIPAQYMLAILSAFVLVGGLPHAEELRRCLQAQRQRLVGRDSPECAQELFG